jgi:hypothetical protein
MDSCPWRCVLLFAQGSIVDWWMTGVDGECVPARGEPVAALSVGSVWRPCGRGLERAVAAGLREVPGNLQAEGRQTGAKLERIFKIFLGLYGEGRIPWGILEFVGRLGSLARGAAAGNGDLNRIRVERIIDRVIEDNQRPIDCGPVSATYPYLWAGIMEPEASRGKLGWTSYKQVCRIFLCVFA